MTVLIKKSVGKKEFQKIVASFNEKKKKGIDTSKYCGVIKLKKDALAIQKEIRNEWNTIVCC